MYTSGISVNIEKNNILLPKINIGIETIIKFIFKPNIFCINFKHMCNHMLSDKREEKC